MYALFAVIYGVPLTQKLHKWLNEHDIDPEECGFEIFYSGSASTTPGYLGVHLTGADECIDANRLDLEHGLLYTGKGYSQTIENSEPHSIIPTAAQAEETNRKIASLPDEVRKMIQPIGTYLIWYTS